jgi:hypothetical protein
MYGVTKLTRTYENGSKQVRYNWNWKQFVFDVKAHWHSWYLRNIGLPLLERQLARIAHTGIQMIEHAEKYVPTWTPSPELIAIIRNQEPDQ